MIQQSQKMVEGAAHEIQQDFSKGKDLTFNNVGPSKDNELAFNKVTTQLPSNPIKPLVSLTQAAGYNRIGASVVDKNNEVIGSMLDIHA
ncbi:hypothetical protein [Vibrio sp. AND4]|uniref:hypothetical protein n=1 Tax=Vibrio sp. AND4 TaxID=314289 RepID=UPI00015EFE99|nr:hypothetical protein [Vibrio sp. AND4]EDP59351.1 hypothetical protein AND4_09267 [Vibrio sp. AND4]